MHIKIIFTVFSLILGFLTFLPYFVEMFKGKARPHIFSWIVWAITGGISFSASLSKGGGGGALISVLQSILCLIIVAYAFFRGEKSITLLDKVSFIAAILLCVFYFFTRAALPSAVVAVSIDLLGFVPTFRKSYLKPDEEPALTYSFSSLAYLFSLGGIGVYNLVTMIAPITLVLANAALVIFLTTRRKILK